MISPTGHSCEQSRSKRWPLFHIQQARSGGIRNLHGEYACQTVADIVFGENNRAGASEDLRFVIAYPKRFGSRETRECRIAHIRNEALCSDTFRHPATLCFAALIGPDDARTQDLVLLVKKDNSTHLT